MQRHIVKTSPPNALTFEKTFVDSEASARVPGFSQRLQSVVSSILCLFFKAIGVEKCNKRHLSGFASMRSSWHRFVQLCFETQKPVRVSVRLALHCINLPGARILAEKLRAGDNRLSEYHRSIDSHFCMVLKKICQRAPSLPVLTVMPFHRFFTASDAVITCVRNKNLVTRRR